VKKSVDIVLAETSAIVSEGLASIFTKWGFKCTLTVVTSLEDAELQIAKCMPNLAIVNPAFIQNNPKAFGSLKCQFDQVTWVGLQYNYYDPKTLSAFDALITVSDTPEQIVAALSKILARKGKPAQSSSHEALSERETDVLRLLATGMSNKEIADRLNISINTVITHRKNISQKTGIKSVSGLTIYAVVQKLVSIDH
jgi:DNA-binding NarL/FixJ family response regulator